MPSRTLIILLFIIPGLLSCLRNPEADRVMDHAEAIIEEHPDSALALMQSLDRRKLSHRAQNARRALLLSLAMHKNYIDVTDDSLIAIADDYYSASDDLHCRMLARFCHGIVQFNSGRYPDAIVSALRAESDATALRDTLWLARTNELMSDIYYETYMFDDAAKHRKIAASFYQKSGKRLNELYAILDYSISDTGLNGIQKQLLLDSIKTVSRKDAIDSLLEAKCLSASISNAVNNDDFDRAISYLDTLSIYNNVYNLSAQDYIYLSIAFVSNGDYDNFKKFQNIGLASRPSSSNIASAISGQIVYFKEIGDFKSAQLYSDSLLKYQNEIVTEVLKLPVSNAVNQYYNVVNRHSNTKANRYKIITLWSVTVAIILIIILCISIYIYKRYKNKVITKQIAEIASLTDRLTFYNISNERANEKLALKERDYSKLKTDLGKSFVNQYASINRLCETFFEADDSSSNVNRKIIFDKVKEEIAIIRSEDNINQLLNNINFYFDNLLLELKHDVPKISDSDILLYALTFLDFSPKTICLTMGIKLPSYYSKRKRLKNKILEAVPDGADKYLRILV